MENKGIIFNKLIAKIGNVDQCYLFFLPIIYLCLHYLYLVQ